MCYTYLDGRPNPLFYTTLQVNSGLAVEFLHFVTAISLCTVCGHQRITQCLTGRYLRKNSYVLKTVP